MNTTVCGLWALGGLSLAPACQPDARVESGDEVGSAAPTSLSAQAALNPRVTAVSPPLASNLGGQPDPQRPRLCAGRAVHCRRSAGGLNVGAVVEPDLAAATPLQLCRKSGGGQGRESRRSPERAQRGPDAL